jgi:hypothetical protein
MDQWVSGCWAAGEPTRCGARADVTMRSGCIECCAIDEQARSKHTSTEATYGTRKSRVVETGRLLLISSVNAKERKSEQASRPFTEVRGLNCSSGCGGHVVRAAEWRGEKQSARRIGLI